jgi:myo-inositol-1(or 4)-monophosphatase
LSPADRRDDLERIHEALEAARHVLAGLGGETDPVATKERGDPLTAADLAVDAALKRLLPRDGEGWLSEETADDPSRLRARRVWVVDPVDGTREFVQGIPEWCVSVGLVEDGEAVAGGILNPVTDQLILGALETGVTVNGSPAPRRHPSEAPPPVVLASRSEVGRGEWERFTGSWFTVVPMGSVAYKLARVAAGLADGTWTLVPKHEWDVAAGTALVRAAGGVVRVRDGSVPRFNRARPKLDGLLALADRSLLERVVPILAGFGGSSEGVE